MTTYSMSSRETVVAALCNATCEAPLWDSLHSDHQTVWLHRASRLINELAKSEHIVVHMDELKE